MNNHKSSNVLAFPSSPLITAFRAALENTLQAAWEDLPRLAGLLEEGRFRVAQRLAEGQPKGPEERVVVERSSQLAVFPGRVTTPTEKGMMRQGELRLILGGISRPTLWKWRKNPDMAFPCVRRIGNLLFWDREEVAAWIKARPGAKTMPAGKTTGRAA